MKLGVLNFGKFMKLVMERANDNTPPPATFYFKDTSDRISPERMAEFMAEIGAIAGDN